MGNQISIRFCGKLPNPTRRRTFRGTGDPSASERVVYVAAYVWKWRDLAEPLPRTAELHRRVDLKRGGRARHTLPRIHYLPHEVGCSILID